MFKRFLFFALVASYVGVVPHGALAANIWDPQPPMNWEEMGRCELVVAAHYESHKTEDALRTDADTKSGLTHDKQQTMVLHVDRVLKGGGVKEGASLRVELRHWYSIELTPPDFFRSEAKPDGIPRLCYKWQPNNPGGLVPCQIVPDVREDALYFFPKESAPALERQEQVQLPSLEGGWRRALGGQTPNLPFLLVQSVSPQRQREALELLDASRDPATLDLLFEWSATPQKLGSFSFVAQQTLMAVGDQNGDVYNRAFKRLSLLPKDWPPYATMTRSQKMQWELDEQKRSQGAAFSRYAQIMAEVDGERAARDFDLMIAHGSPALAEVAGEWLGFTYSEHALNLSFQLLKHPETASMGATALRNLLRPADSSARSPHERERQTAHLRVLAMPRLSRALHLKVFDASRTEAAMADNAPDSLEWMRLNREALEATLAENQAPTPVDLIHARQVLLHPDDKTFDFGSYGRGGHFIQGEGIQLIEAIDHAADPRFIPLLVEMMRAVSPGLQKGEVQGTLQHYVLLYPFAFKREMGRQGLTREFYNASPLKGQGFDARLMAMLGNPLFVWSLEWPDSSRFGARALSSSVFWIQRYAASPALLHDVAESIRTDLAGNNVESAMESLRFLLLADPTAAHPLLDRALQMRGNRSRHERAPLLALGVANGHGELLGELMHLVTVADQQQRASASPPFDGTELGSFNEADADPRVLLWVRQPQATALYLKVLDERLTDLDNEEPFYDRRHRLSPAPAELLQALFAEHPREFFERTSRAMGSPSLAQRQVAEQVLNNTLGWDLDLEAQTLARARTLKLKTIQPLMARLGTLDEPQLRELLLEQLGFSVPSSPAARQNALLHLASDLDPAVAFNARRLLELMLGDDSVEGLVGLSPSQKEIAFKALLHDRADRK